MRIFCTRILSIVAILVSTAALCSTPATGQTINDPQVNGTPISGKDIYELYQRQLQSVLKTRLQEEEDYVNAIVDLVREEKLPKAVVDRAWLWVRSNRVASQYPFVYFERILQLQAKKLKLDVPKFDRTIYSRARTNSVTRKRR